MVVVVVRQLPELAVSRWICDNKDKTQTTNIDTKKRNNRVDLKTAKRKRLRDDHLFHMELRRN